MSFREDTQANQYQFWASGDSAYVQWASNDERDAFQRQVQAWHLLSLERGGVFPDGSRLTHTWMGQSPNQGRIEVGTRYPKEGYAVLRCGNTEVRINFTLLTSVLLKIDSNSGPFTQLGDLQRAIYAVTAEASMGRTGDDNGE